MQEEKKEKKYINIRIAAAFILVSFVAGIGGGYIGAWKLLKNNGIANIQATSSGQKISFIEDSAIVDVVKKTAPAVVSIIVSQDVNKYLSQYEMDPFAPFFGFGNRGRVPSDSTPNFQQVGAGTGFFVSNDGIVVTNKHVVSDEGAKYTVVTQDKQKYEATVLARDPRNDLAILKVEIKNAPFLTLADSKLLQIGQRVVAIGNSLGQYPNTVTSGIVSGIGRSITAGGNDGSEQLSGVVQTDAAINPGNSGGPLLDIAGNVVGINTAIDREGQSVGFAIPSNDAQRAIDTYKKTGKITRPFLGVRYMIIDPEQAKEQNLPKSNGALVLRGDTMTDFAVVPGSPADKAGIVENDIILQVDGKDVTLETNLTELLKDKQVGDDATLRIYHKGEEKTVKVKLEEAK